MKKITLIVLALMMVLVTAGCVKSDAETVEVDGETFITIYGATGDECFINSTQHNMGSDSESIMLGYLNVPEETMEEYRSYLKENGWDILDEREIVNFGTSADIAGLHSNYEEIAYSNYSKNDGECSIFIYDYLDGQVAILYAVSK